ncbi:phosphoenolpyruvate carboxylase [Bradymonas sediminis]|uniref:Phosphoenolpyruvate carboxylase n=1 Tax=Bradymonas sediminis TaxID=1548548 RepID=A0A2Z4FNS2_9DELT|nr:phosphoenolpyruvate carboxylase [Bradymonas sediminis]AWV90386.1 phosphoenolpyruvate carboxylase [Bradymonas sediminis]
MTSFGQEEKPRLTEDLRTQVDLLGRALGDAIKEHYGETTYELVESLRSWAQRTDAGEELFRQVAKLSLPEIENIIRSYTSYFHLANKAEQLEIARINRKREFEATVENPRSESIAQGVESMRQAGWSDAELTDFLKELRIEPTLTAHPTEARRETLLNIQQRIAGHLKKMAAQTQTPAEAKRIEEALRSEVALMLLSDQIRTERKTVDDEVDFGLYFLATTIWDAVPKIQRDLQRALSERSEGDNFDQATELPALFRYSSWIGGDRDGNPNVTVDTTRNTFEKQRRVALKKYIKSLRLLRQELSVSEVHVTLCDALFESLAEDKKSVKLSKADTRLVERDYAHEPFRRKLTYMLAKLNMAIDQGAAPTHFARGAAASTAAPEERYRAEQFQDELKLIGKALHQAGLSHLANGRLTDLLAQVATFGFRLASLDFRQHSRVHEAAVSELLAIAGVASDYMGMPEEARLELLNQELQNPRPLRPRGHVELSEQTRDLLEVFEVARQALEEDPGAVRAWVISMTHELSDLLEVLLLAKESGLWVHRPGERGYAPIEIVPLLETIEDLAHVDTFMAKLFENPAYAAQLDGRERFQEVMVGYSDSSKDGGYWMANWSQHKAQRALGEVSAKYNVQLCMFHGRGGTVGRGGGHSTRAIVGIPPQSYSGRIRFTEQGEVISFRYSLEPIAHRHLEQLVHAMAQAAQGARDYRAGDAKNTARDQAMEAVAARSMRVYRELIDDPEFWPWYQRVTPIEHISRLPIASRPSSRSGPAGPTFDSLRAIPWNFAWTQTRYNTPGWYGMGTGLEEAVEANEINLEDLRDWYKNWSYFQGIIDNAQLEMARARLAVSRQYCENLAEDMAFHERLEKEFELTRKWLLKITETDELLSKNNTIRQLIAVRNPYTDVLNALQIELMTRWQKADCADLGHALLLSLNGVAAAMQNTG